jgi:protein phosphatase
MDRLQGARARFMGASSEEGRLALRYEAVGRTDIGRARRTNQDKFGIAEDLGLAVVCDGMGGPAGGEIASAIAMESFLAVVRQEIENCRCAQNGLTARALRRAAAAANRTVRAHATHDTRFRGMGTTLVAARLEGCDLTVLNVGDSRAYLMHGGTARQLTLDHSYVAERMRLGVMTATEGAQSPLQSVITRAIGIEEDVRPDVSCETVAAGDLLLLCSDGLTRHVSDEEFAKVGSGDTSQPIVGLCDELIALANARGGTDNITCVLARFTQATSE